eukprot:jgi/Phyca11/81029/gw1.14.768.1
MTAEEIVFWPTYNWCNNPWVVGADGRVLDRRKYGKIRPCALEDLHICRTGRTTYTMEIPAVGETTYTQAKLRRWGVSILWNSPPLEIGEELTVPKELQLRGQQDIELEKDYTWSCTRSGYVTGTPTDQVPADGEGILLRQQPNGIYW